MKGLWHSGIRGSTDGMIDSFHGAWLRQYWIRTEKYRLHTNMITDGGLYLCGTKDWN